MRHCFPGRDPAARPAARGSPGSGPGAVSAAGSTTCRPPSRTGCSLRASSTVADLVRLRPRLLGHLGAAAHRTDAPFKTAEARNLLTDLVRTTPALRPGTGSPSG
ncbi:hypothetical protein [Streptomyces sp. NPDC005890]|uniref:hypothetical protein n=1 Tax=Streptomyces sp. NPDC005890 TaxID=3154568 RepID=UPI00340FB661